jgi:hypothetical protein
MYEYSTRDPRDPEDREIDECDPIEKKDKMMDKTVADTFPASDPPSSIPDPDEDSFASTECKRDGQNLAPGNITPT